MIKLNLGIQAVLTPGRVPEVQFHENNPSFAVVCCTHLHSRTGIQVRRPSRSGMQRRKQAASEVSPAYRQKSQMKQKLDALAMKQSQVQQNQFKQNSFADIVCTYIFPNLDEAWWEIESYYWSKLCLKRQLCRYVCVCLCERERLPECKIRRELPKKEVKCSGALQPVVQQYPQQLKNHHTHRYRRYRESRVGLLPRATMMSAEVFEQETHSLSRALTPSPSPLHSPHRVPVTQCITIEETKENFYYGEKLYLSQVHCRSGLLWTQEQTHVLEYSM